MFRRLWTMTLLSILMIGAVIANNSAAQEIVAIRVEGNKRTKSWVVLRELKTQVGDTLNPEQLSQDRDRVLNLQLFERAKLSTAPGPEGDTLIVRVWERWYIFPFPVLFINEHDFKKLSYGAGLVHFNFRGRAEVLNAVGWAGYNPGAYLTYHNPWFGGNSRLFAELQVSAQSIRSKSLELPTHDERRRMVSFLLGKRFGYGVYVSGTARYTDRKTDPPVPGAVNSPNGRDRFGTVGGQVLLDWRDFRGYPSQGVYLRLMVLHHGSGSRWVDYDRWSADVRFYRRLLVGSLALRTAGTLSRGTVPVYDRVYIGYQERIRGHFGTKKEGENRFVGSVEWRVTLLPVRYSEFSGLSAFLKTWKFGINAAFFADAGKVWTGYERFGSGEWLRGFGVGLHLRVPYVEVLRAELAFDEKGRAELIFDVGVSF